MCELLWVPGVLITTLLKIKAEVLLTHTQLMCLKILYSEFEILYALHTGLRSQYGV
jgi:hypothetical protein